jgi:RNA polymerase sigma-70 factor (ECF subfamily)
VTELNLTDQADHPPPAGTGDPPAAGRPAADPPAADRSDAELILASRQDPELFRLLYDRWAGPLLTYLYRRTLDPEVAADLLAETFAVAFARRRRFRDQGRPGSGWLFGIAAKELSHWYRHEQAHSRAMRRLGLQRPALDEESIARIEELADIVHYRAELTAALAQLTAAERQAVQLRVIDELQYAQIAARLGCSEGAARVRVHRGLGRLANLMEVTA